MKSTFQKIVINKPDPELSTKEKLEQIRSGGRHKRTKSGLQKKSYVISGRDGSKIIKNQTEEQFEESGVKKKKRNYVMYESKLSTEKNTSITKVETEKKPPRQPSPRIEEKIIITKKRKDFLDNYQYHESKVLKDLNPKYQGYVVHKRLGPPIGGYEEKTYQQRQITVKGMPGFPENQKYSTKTTVVKTPYKPLVTSYRPSRSSYKATESTYKPITTEFRPTPTPMPYRPTLTSYNTNTTTTTTYRPMFTKKETPIKTPYPRIRENRPFRLKETKRVSAKTPGNKSELSYQVSRRDNNAFDYSESTYNPRQTKNYVKKTETFTNQTLGRGIMPNTTNEIKQVRTYKTRNRYEPKNYSRNIMQSNDGKTSFTQISITKTENEPKKRFEDELYDTKIVSTITRTSRRIDGGNNERNNDNRGNLSSRYEITIEKRKEVVDDSGTYGKGPSIRRKYKHKKY